MIDVIDGFKTKGVADITKKHAIQSVKMLILGFIAVIPIRFLMDKDELFSLNAELVGGGVALVIICIADYLRAVVKLGSSRSS